MTWDNGLWAVEGGSTSADVGRRVAYAAVGGYVGVTNPADLQVRETDVPSSQIRVGPGGCTVPVRALGKPNQIYVGYNPDDDLLTIPATGSDAGRSDLIVARVENPVSGEPWQPPADPVNGQYIFTRRYPNVPNTTTDVWQIDESASALTLARLDIPPSTGTITQDMITDLRKQSGFAVEVAENKTLLLVDRWSGSTDTSDTLGPTNPSGGWVVWPAFATWQVRIPSWAVAADVDAAVFNAVLQLVGDWGDGYKIGGFARVSFQQTPGDSSGELPSTDNEFDLAYDMGDGVVPNLSQTMVNIPLLGTINIPRAKRGTLQYLVFEFWVIDYTNTSGRNYWGQLSPNYGTTAKALLNFRSGTPQEYATDE